MGVHVIFHVSMLRKYTPDPTHVVDWGELVFDADGTFEEGPVHIKDSREQVLRGKIMRLDREASEGVMAAPRSGEGNMGTGRHYTYQLSFLI